ncbi:hypothetical protein [Subtercola sp. RTI3]|uniref:hypothetical protein n=1 Tax=Subtercola sp. RTI3 TaxID=3048639 RepID=UPI002B2298F1|nr:hypothetical protein [Subtercola sp. RTI3]MEA9987071.1 hypothetical protein [Subtercola sp. RTI3]
MTKGETVAAGDRVAGAPVSLIIQRRIVPGSDEAYRAWELKLGAVLAAWTGFIDRTVIEPSPPAQTDWVLVQRFENAEAAQSWLQSGERATLFAEIEHIFVGQEEFHFVTEHQRQVPAAASIIVTSRVPVDRESEFLEWQRRISAAEASFAGFRGHKIERPTPGLQDDWTVILSFDSDEHLSAWVESPQRTRLLSEGESFNAQMKVSRSRYGFSFWDGSRSGVDTPSRLAIFKDNLLVLLVLYPIVFLFGFFISAPLLEANGVPFWASLFIGNVFSTQLLGWVVAPWIFRVFGWWHAEHISRGRNLAGYGILIVLYAALMGLDAWLIALRS